MPGPSRSSLPTPIEPQLDDNRNAIVRRYVDACAACKEARIQCDGGKPTCKHCARHRAFCRYSTFTFDSVHIDPPEYPGEQHKSVESNSLPPILDRPVAADRARQTLNPTPESTVALQPQAATNAPVGDVRNETLVPRSHPALHFSQALHKSDDATHYRASSSSNVSSVEPRALESASARDGDYQNRHRSASLCHTSLDGIGPSLTPATRQILADANAQHLLDFFRFHTISTWHPQLPTIAKNGAVEWLLPMALEDPVVLEALLTQAAAQRLFQEPAQRMAMETHKTRCIKLICQHGCLQAQENGSAYALEVVAATGALITAAADVVGSNDWAEDCQRARLYLMAIKMPVDERHAYVYNRLLKQLCFSEIARPTWKEVPLFDTIQGNQQDEAFGLPGLGLKLVTLIARCSLQRGSSVALINDRAHETTAQGIYASSTHVATSVMRHRVAGGSRNLALDDRLVLSPHNAWCHA